jgi:hypothetical protein
MYVKGVDEMKRNEMIFIKINKMNNNSDNVGFEKGNIIRILYIDRSHHVMSVNAVVTDVFERFITVLYLTPDLKHSDNRLPVIKVENNVYRVTPILFYIFKDFYKYVDVITTLDEDLFDLIKFTTIEQPTDLNKNKLSYRLKRFYKKEVNKCLSVFYDIMINSIVKNDI